MKQGLSFDDVLLVPKQGHLSSRKDADISSEVVPGWGLRVPILSANMPTVTGPAMAVAMTHAGGLGILPRFNTIPEAISELEACKFGSVHGAIPTVGMNDWDRVTAFGRWGCYTLCVDVAHGDHEEIHVFVKNLVDEGYTIIVGNIATYEGAKRACLAGASGIKVGIGPGAACTTREVTGFGVPQLTAIMDVAAAIDAWADKKVTLIADGGIKNSGDIVKALAAGADTVMLGRLLAGTNEAATPGYYAGSASAYFKPQFNAPEGVHGDVERTGSVEEVVKQLAWGIRSGISYGGATNIQELRIRAEFIQVTPQAAIESGVRL